jgi:hypothetical protein
MGWDPYDGLNSRLFQAMPFKNMYLARLAWIQGFKRSPINLRKVLGVPKQHNSKGIGLFLFGYCRLYELAKSDSTLFGTLEAALTKINTLAELLISLKCEGYSGACWGYNFDWQNRVFFQPYNTPTVVATSFAANALFEAYEVTNNRNYLEVALSAADFIGNDLNRTYEEDGFILSYSPLDNSKVYNASLLGGRLLARSFYYTKNLTHKKFAEEIVMTIVKKQNTTGSWIYGEGHTQGWIDSFHTGFNLECIYEYAKYTGDTKFQDSFNLGLDYYLNNFFESDGRSKYYHDKLYPIDIHSPAQLLVTLAKTCELKNNLDLAKKVLDWTIQNMQSKKGYFFYQLKPIISSKISYMRWAQAWMFYALTNYFKACHNENLD